MAPREKIVFLDINKPWAQNLQKIMSTRFTRYPLCDGTLEHSVGIVHIKDLAAFLGSPQKGPDLGKVRRSVVIVGEDMPLDALLAEFQQRHLQLALLANPKGRVTGMVTLEDVLEELVGEIRDEFYREKETRIGAMLRPQTVVLDLTETTREAAIGALVRRLAALHPEIQPDSAAAGVIQRETSMPTGIGSGIAIPHARIEGIKGVALAFGRSASGIDFRAPDGAAARLIFLILAPIHDEGAQIRTLAQIARVTTKSEVRQVLLEAGTAEEVCQRIRDAEAAL
jgi:mannitol/fructose-specific phosphotransferase system IIA component (Ntr-type)